MRASRDIKIMRVERAHLCTLVRVRMSVSLGLFREFENFLPGDFPCQVPFSLAIDKDNR